MNKKMIGKLVGVLFFLEALFMLPAIAVCFVYGETGAPLRGFLWTVALLLALSGALYGVCEGHAGVLRQRGLHHRGPGLDPALGHGRAAVLHLGRDTALCRRVF